MEEEYRTRSKFHCYINIVDRIIPGTPLTIHCIHDSVIHEFDRAMPNVFVGPAQDLMVERLISNVRARITRSGYATYTYK